MEKIIKELLSNPYFECEFSRDFCFKHRIHAPLIVNYTPGNSKLYLVTGENATGKSFFIKSLVSLLKDKKIKTYHAGLIHRAGDHENGFTEHEYSLIPEVVASSGENTSILLTNGLEGSKAIKDKHVILLDEPSLGFSAGYQIAIADYVLKYMEKVPDSLFGLMIVEHSPLIISGLANANPTHIRFGDCKSLEQVIGDPYHYSTGDLKKLRGKSKKIRYSITRVLERIKKINS